MAGAAAQAVEHLSVPRPSGGAPVRCLRRTPAAKGRGPGLVYLPGLLSSSGGVKGRALDALVERRLGCGLLAVDYLDASGPRGRAGCLEAAQPGAWLADARAALDACLEPGARHIVVGASLGALLALQLAAERPDAIAGLVLVSPRAGLGERLWQGLDEAQQERLLAGGALEMAAGVLDFDVGAAVEPTVSLPFFTALDALEPPDAPNSIDVAACPVRLLHGLCDHVTPVAAAGRLVGQISGSDVALTVLKSAGARLHAPDELDALAAAVMALWEQDLRRARAGGGGGGNKKNSAGE